MKQEAARSERERGDEEPQVVLDGLARLEVVTVAEQGTVSKASARLGVAQPALSRQIQDLEGDLGSIGEPITRDRDLDGLTRVKNRTDVEATGDRSSSRGTKTRPSPRWIILSIFIFSTTSSRGGRSRHRSCVRFTSTR